MSIFLIHKDEFEKKHHILISGGEISESIFVDEKGDGGIVILTNNTCFLKMWKDILLMERFLHQFDMVITVSHYLQGFIHLRWCRISSINSTYRWPGKILEHKENNILQYYHDIMVRIQVCSRKGISSTICILGMGCWNHRSYSTEGSGFLGSYLIWSPKVQGSVCCC